jgi:membrane protease YdiL (CAAX protease family)
VVALAGPPLFAVLPDRLFGASPSLGTQLVLQLLYCGLAGFIVWFVLRVEHLPLQSIGVRSPSVPTIVWAIAVALVALYLLPIVTTPLAEALGDDGLEAGVQRLAALPVWFRVLIAVTGGAIEETLYRGYAVERLTTITGRAWLGGAVATIAFALAHIPGWGLGFALGADLPFGILMTVFYLWKRNLPANILAHVIALLVGILTV